MLQTKGNVLVIDDDPLLLMNYADLLDDANYTVTEASSFTTGLNSLQNREFDIIICDHDLGDGKGIDIVKSLISQNKQIPIIYLTGAQTKVLDEVKQLPIVKEVLAKPVSEEKILELVETHISVIEQDKFPRLIGDDEREQLLNNFMFNQDSE